MTFVGRTSDTLSINFFIFLQGLHQSAPNLNIKTPGFIFNNSINTSRPPVYSTIRVVSTIDTVTPADVGVEPFGFIFLDYIYIYL